MPVEQAGTNPPETDDPLADARAAYAEVAGKMSETVEEKPEAPDVQAEPEPKADVVEKAEPKADHPTDPKRFADGTFKPTGEDKPAAEDKGPVPVKAETEVKPAEQPVQQQPTVGSPPGGFSPRTKADWEKITAAYPHLAADIAKREQEVAAGFAQYEGMRELRPYVEMARAQGQSLKQALDNYTGIEAALRDPQRSLNTLLHLAGNAGYPPQRLAMELAPYLGLSNGQQNGAPQNGAQPPVDPSMLQQWLNPLAQEVNTLKSLFQQQSERQRADQMTAISTVVDRFKAAPEHRYYDNVEPKMAQLLESGVIPRTGDYATDLQQAYDMACRLDPEISELLLNERIAKTEAARVKAEKEAGAKAREASRSITGSPSSTVRETDDKGGDSPFDAARAAYREVSARV